MSRHEASNLRRFRPATVVLAGLALGLGVVLAATALTMPPRPAELEARLPALADARLLADASGVANPVTAVLLNFRAYDTLLELAVLVLAVLSVGAMPASADPPRQSRPWVPNELLAATIGIVVPVSIVVAGDLLWMGADHPGGAFQAGAVLSGAGIMLLLAGRFDRRLLDDWRGRLAVVAGVAAFVVAGTAVMLVGRQFLQYPDGYAKTLILAIETAAMASVAAVFVLLFDAVAGRLAAQGGAPELEEPRR